MSRNDTPRDDDRPRRSYGPIAEPPYSTGPMGQAHTDLPGGEKRKSQLDREIERQLEEALERDRRRLEEGLRIPGVEYGPASHERAYGGSDPGSVLGLRPETLAERLLDSGLLRAPGRRDELDLGKDYEDRARRERLVRHRELPNHINPRDLAETGWGVIFAQGAGPALERQLEPLITRRRDQAGGRFKTLWYEPWESARRFLWYRHGETPGTLDTDNLPYYLLVVGDPETLPFEFQYQLSVNHAVGRLHFDDPAAYGRYAEAVVAAEEDGVDLARRAALFSAENGDDTTALLARHLVSPLAENLFAPGWQVEAWRRERAHKSDLARLLGGDATPGLLLASCHGKAMWPGEPDQRRYQGALLCQDWPGPTAAPAATPEHFFHAGDLAADARVHGLVAFFFACFGAGTPLVDNVPLEATPDPASGRPRLPALAPRPFVSELSQALLGRGALAVVGHVDRGWTLSFAWHNPRRGGLDAATYSLEDSLRQLLAGERLGHALRPLHRRYTALAAQLAETFDQFSRGLDPEVLKADLARQWTAHNDARNFILLGDPAVCLRGKTSPLYPVYLREEAHRYATAQARAQGLDVSQWLDQRLRKMARGETN